MTSGERFGLIISLLGLIFATLTALLGFIIKITRRWTQTEDKLGTLISEVSELIIRKDADHESIRAEVDKKEQRGDVIHRDLSERLTWLERRELSERRRKDRP
jgi:uncharacterized protein Yka (UPF0111/DUF47 family)